VFLRKKIILCIILIFIICLISSGCWTNVGYIDSSRSNESTKNPLEDRRIRVGISVAGSLNEAINEKINTYKTDAEKYVDPTILIAGPYVAEYDQQRFIYNISTFSQMFMDAIIVEMVDGSLAQEVIDKSFNIPIIFTTVLPTEESLLGGKVAFVGWKEAECGRMQADTIAPILKAKGLKEINYVILMGDITSSQAKQRTQGVLDGLTASGLTPVKVLEENCEWDSANAKSAVEKLLSEGVRIDCIISNWDDGALAAVEAVKSAGKIGEIPIAGIGGTKNAIASIKAGELTMTVLQDNIVQAKTALELAVKAARREALEKYYWMTAESITTENADKY